MEKDDVSSKWIAEKDLPQKLIEEFDSGTTASISVMKSSTAGQIMYTAFVEKENPCDQPNSKKMKLHSWTSTSNTGYFNVAFKMYSFIHVIIII